MSNLENGDIVEPRRPEPVHSFFNLSVLAAVSAVLGLTCLGWAMYDGLVGAEFGE